MSEKKTHRERSIEFLIQASEAMNLGKSDALNVASTSAMVMALFDVADAIREQTAEGEKTGGTAWLEVPNG